MKPSAICFDINNVTTEDIRFLYRYGVYKALVGNLANVANFQPDTISESFRANNCLEKCKG